MLPAILLFAITYVLMLTFSRFRPWFALASGLIFVLTGMLPGDQILGALDFNVLLMIGGTMGLVQLFIDSRLPERMADMIMAKVPNVQWAAVCLSLFAGIISAFVDNVATVLMVAPVAIEICKKLKTNPVPFIISIAVSSNLQGAATLVGDTTALMLGSALDMSFLDFFFYQGKPGMFFAVELGAVLSALIVWFIFRKEKSAIPSTGKLTEVRDYVPTVLLFGAIGLLILASFAPGGWNLPDETNGLICCGLLLIGLVYNYARNKSLDAVTGPLKAIDLETLGLLTGLFLMIGGIAAQMGCDPTVFYFGLLSGATLGGNCTPIGASANITGIGILRREGHEVRNADFFRIGIPFTLAAIVPAYIYLWVLFGV